MQSERSYSWKKTNCAVFFYAQKQAFLQNVSNLTPKCVKHEICKRPSFCYHIVSSRDKPTEPMKRI
nr:MAG TPA: hypothetical protein [Caudoviricetes sp.]